MVGITEPTGELERTDSTSSFKNGQQKDLKEFYRNRHEEYLRKIQNSLKSKQAEENRTKELHIKNKEKLQQDLGYRKVTSKLMEPTITSMISSNYEPDTIKELKGQKAANLLTWGCSDGNGGRYSVQDKLTDSLPKVKENNGGLLQRAQQNIAKVAERKAAEAKKIQEEKSKKLRIAAAARAAVKTMKPADYVRPKPAASASQVTP